MRREWGATSLGPDQVLALAVSLYFFHMSPVLRDRSRHSVGERTRSFPPQTHGCVGCAVLFWSLLRKPAGPDPHQLIAPFLFLFCDAMKSQPGLILNSSTTT